MKTKLKKYLLEKITNPTSKKRSSWIITAWLIFISTSTLVTFLRHIAPTPSFLEGMIQKTALIISAAMWALTLPSTIIFATAILIILFTKRHQSKNELTKDEEQAKNLINKFEKKCKNRKAFMLTGPWGFGKTCFYQASLKPKIEGFFSENHIIETSCFGINNENDLVNQILNKTMPLEWLGIFLNYIRLISSASSILKRVLIPSNSIIVIDDFEAANLVNKSYKELLGLIDYLIHKKNCSIFILCNDKEISDEGYKQFCQKIVVKYEFTPSIGIIKQIIENFSVETEKKPYSFDKIITNNLVILVEKIKNLRLARDAIIDIEEFSEKLVEKVNLMDLPYETKNKWLSHFFTEDSPHLIKAYFIKNYHKIKEWRLYRENHEQNFDATVRSLDTNEEVKDATPNDKFLVTLGETKLNESDSCTLNQHLDLTAYEILLDQDTHSLDECFFNAIIQSLARKQTIHFDLHGT